MKLNINNINSNCNELFNELKLKINNCDKLDDCIKNNYDYVNKLNIIFDNIYEYCKKIELKEFYIDNYSFEFIIKVKEGNEKDLFPIILTLKNNFEFVEDFTFRMESLENILINLK